VKNWSVARRMLCGLMTISFPMRARAGCLRGAGAELRRQGDGRRISGDVLFGAVGQTDIGISRPTAAFSSGVAFQ